MKKLSIASILKHQEHRDWPIPNRSWSYYQEWNHVVFLHYKCDAEVIQALLPKGLIVDVFQSHAWVSLVAFSMEKARPKNLPSVGFISDFLEINLRTYVVKDNKPGVFFLNIESEKVLSTFVAKTFSGLPYEKAEMMHNRTEKRFVSDFSKRNFHLDITYQIGEQITQVSELEHFLVERYCLYLDQNNILYRNEVQHLPWVLNKMELIKKTVNYRLPGLDFIGLTPDLTHYSNGVQVVAWSKEILTKNKQ